MSTDQSTVSSDQTKVTSDEAGVVSAQQAVAKQKTTNTQAAQQAQAKVTADQAALTSAEQAVAAQKTTNTKGTQQAQATVQQAQAALVAAQQAVAKQKTTNTQAAQQAQAKVTADQAALTSAEQAVAKQKTTNAAAVRQANDQIQAAKISVDQDKATLAKDEASAAVSAGGNLYTELPTSGQVIRRGQQLFGIGGNPVVLLYGDVTPARAFLPGMPPGRDVAALNANLDALGYARELKGGRFTPATEKAVKAFQKAHGMADTGQLPLGSVIFEPGAVRVTSVVPKLGSNVGAGQPVLDVTLLTRQVNISLDAAQQSEVKVGDKVSIVLPDNSTTPGVVSSVGKVASTSSNGTTITVLVTPTNPAATGTLDSAPVNVWITEASAPNAYIVPVDALVALSSGGYALEVAGANGVHTLEAVSLGLFDDADGLVQVNGPQVRAGQKIVVPAP